MNFTKKENNVQAFVNLRIRLIVLFRRQTFFKKCLLGFIFSQRSHQKKSVLTLQVISDKGFHIVLQHFTHIHRQKVFNRGASSSTI